MPEYVWIYDDKRGPECVSYNTYNTRSKMLQLLNTPSWIFERVLNMWWVSNMSLFPTLKDCQYARVLNFQGNTGFKYVRKYDWVLNMGWDAITEGFWIFQNPKYSRFLHVQALRKVLNMPEYAWIMLEQTVPTMAGCEYVWSMFHRVLKFPPVLKMLGLGIWQSCGY